MLELYFFNVGHGDSIAIKFPNDEWGVIDCHRVLERKNPIVLDFLKNNNVKKLKFICITHPHSDHISGMDIIENEYGINIEKLLLFGVSTGSPCEKHKDTCLMKTILSFAQKRKNAEDIIELDRDYSDTIGNTSIEILNPTSEIRKLLRLRKYNTEHSDFNIESIVIIIRYAEKQILLTGDVPSNLWLNILNNPKIENIKADIIKISHHGSTNGNTMELLNKIVQEGAIAIISTDGGIKYPTIPSKDIINHLQLNLNCTVLQTSMLGTIQDTIDEDIINNDIIDMLTEEIIKDPSYNGYFKISIDENGNIAHSQYSNV